MAERERPRPISCVQLSLRGRLHAPLRNEEVQHWNGVRGCFFPDDSRRDHGHANCHGRSRSGNGRQGDHGDCAKRSSETREENENGV